MRRCLPIGCTIGTLSSAALHQRRLVVSCISKVNKLPINAISNLLNYSTRIADQNKNSLITAGGAGSRSGCTSSVIWRGKMRCTASSASGEIGLASLDAP
jgi:hypothetical protein